MSYIIENFEYRDSENNLVVVPKLEIEEMFNTIKFGQWFGKFNETGNYEEYADNVLPAFVVYPEEFKDKKTFINDFAALDELLGFFIEIMTKKLEAQPKRKKSALKMESTSIIQDKVDGTPT